MQCARLQRRWSPSEIKIRTIPCDLSCYYAQLGWRDVCQPWFKKVTGIDEHVRRYGLADKVEKQLSWLPPPKVL